MNAARRAICADLRQNGLSGKEAYEATKKTEFIQKWKRIVETRQIGVASTKPKPEKVVTWISQFLERRAKKEAEQMIQNQKRQTEVNEQKRFIAKVMASGTTLAGAMVRWKQHLDKKEAEKA